MYSSTFRVLALSALLVLATPAIAQEAAPVEAPAPTTSADSSITLEKKTRIKGDLRTGDNMLDGSSTTSANSGMVLGDKVKIKGDLYTGSNTITGGTDATANSGIVLGDKVRIKGDIYTGDNTVDGATGTVSENSGIIMGDKVRIKGNIYSGSNIVNPDGSVATAGQTQFSSGSEDADKPKRKGREKPGADLARVGARNAGAH